MNFEAIGGRRFLLCVAIDLASIWLQYVGKLDPAGSTLSMILIGTAGAYIAGNVAQRKIEK